MLFRSGGAGRDGRPQGALSPVCVDSVVSVPWVGGRATGSSGIHMLPQAGITRTRIRRIGRHPLGMTWVRVGYPLPGFGPASECQPGHGSVPKRLRMPRELYCTCAVFFPLVFFRGTCAPAGLHMYAHTSHRALGSPKSSLRTRAPGDSGSFGGTTGPFPPLVPCR